MCSCTVLHIRSGLSYLKEQPPGFYVFQNGYFVFLNTVNSIAKTLYSKYAFKIHNSIQIHTQTIFINVLTLLTCHNIIYAFDIIVCTHVNWCLKISINYINVDMVYSDLDVYVNGVSVGL